MNRAKESPTPLKAALAAAASLERAGKPLTADQVVGGIAGFIADINGYRGGGGVRAISATYAATAWLIAEVVLLDEGQDDHGLVEAVSEIIATVQWKVAATALKDWFPTSDSFCEAVCGSLEAKSRDVIRHVRSLDYEWAVSTRFRL